MDDWESEDFVPTLNFNPPNANSLDGKFSPPPAQTERAESVRSDASDSRKSASVAGDEAPFDGALDVEASLEALVKYLTTKVKKEKRMNMVRQIIETALSGGVGEVLTVENTIDLVKKLAEKRNKIQAILKKIKEEQERQARLDEDMYDEDLDYQYENYDDAASAARSFQAERTARAKESRAAFAQNKAKSGKK